MSQDLLTLKSTALCWDEVVEVDLGLLHRRHHQRDMSSTPRSENASMNQPPAEPSRAADLGGGTLTIDQVIQIVTVATRQIQESSEK